MAAVAHLKIGDLYRTLQKSTNEETALAVVHAFEQLQEEQELRSVQTKKEILKEISLKDLATKKDLLELKLEIHGDISGAKWQVIGAIAAMFFAEVILRHFGL